MVGITLMSPLVGPSRPTLFQRGLYSDAFGFQPFPAPSRPMLMAVLLSRFAPRVGLVTLRQTFVRRCHSGNNRPCWGLKDEQSELFSPEF
jgi:hypothetical protein